MSNEKQETIADDFKERPMADTKKNALAELAKRLDIIVFGLVTDGHPCDETIDIRKAQRIVSELAKVSDGNWEVICDGPPAYFCTAGDLEVQCAIGRCRAIAEEGGANGK